MKNSYKSLKKAKRDMPKCCTCKHVKKNPKQFPCTWCINLPVVYADYYEKENQKNETR